MNRLYTPFFSKNTNHYFSNRKNELLIKTIVKHLYDINNKFNITNPILSVIDCELILETKIVTYFIDLINKTVDYLCVNKLTRETFTTKFTIKEFFIHSKSLSTHNKI
jgi:hypothetical protein